MLREVTIARAEQRDLDAVAALLRACGLPIDGVSEHFADFVVARRDNAVCAVAGLEPLGDVALLRSVAVKEAMRGQGIARALCDLVLARAHAAGARRAFLLTTTAADFFRVLGFSMVARDAAPDAIRRTREFASLCPETALLMAMDLERRPKNVLFLCTGNSARSILAEAYLNHAGRGRFKAYSAGSHPAGRVNPFARRLLNERNIDASEARSKSWDEFASGASPAIDLIVTVCDNAAGEACPVWPGRPITAHWGVPDPAAAEGSDADKRAAFAQAFAALKERIDALLALPLEGMEGVALKAKLDEIGRR